MAEAPISFSMSELAERSAAPVSAIKFYLREGLLPPANLEASHRSFYGEPHVARLRLIRVLREVADVPVPAIRDICALVDGEGARDLAGVIAHVLDALGRRQPAATAAELAAAKGEVAAMLDSRGVRVRRNAKAVVDLADTLVGLRRTLGADFPATGFAPYLDAMCALAERDFAVNADLVADASSATLGALLGTVLWEPVLLLLRRIAHEHMATKTFGGRTPPQKKRA